MNRIQRILVPIDFSETSDYALDYAIDLAQQLGAKVTVMHAYEVPIYGIPEGAMIVSSETAAKLADAAKDALESAVESRRSKGVAIETELRMGPPVDEVNDVARRIEADLIVMGTHGRRGIARALLGSVAENVIRTSTRPVMAVHAPKRAA
jgi:nucleotide-binding universal stress UspA family protein